MQIRNQQDFWSGVMFTVAGLAFAGFAREYDMGTAQRMGPAFFPTMLGLLLAALGVIICIKGLATKTKDGHIQKFNFATLGWVLGAVVLFGILLRPAGLVVSLIVLVFVASMGSHEFKLRDTALLTTGLVILVLIVFIWGLKLTIPVWPVFMRD